MEPTNESGLQRVLAATTLAGRPVRSLPVPGTTDLALAVPCTGDEVLSAWTAGRSMLSETGRWPVVVSSWGGGEVGDLVDPFSRYPYVNSIDDAATTDHSPAAVISRSEALGIEDALALWRPRWFGDEPMSAYADSWLKGTAEFRGISPSVDEASAAIGADATLAQLERWLLDWEVQRFGPTSPYPPEVAMEWLVPPDPCAVMFLPTPLSWHTNAYLGYFGASSRNHESLCTIMHAWHQRYGAEIVANWGTFMQFVIARPPFDLDAAWEYATQVSMLGPSLQVPIRYIALAALTSRQGVLHERP